jgi:hypothetical protein
LCHGPYVDRGAINVTMTDVSNIDEKRRCVLKAKADLPFSGFVRFRITIGLCILLWSSIFACGGGGGSSDGTAALAYTGATTPAFLTVENSETLIGESFRGALTSDSMVPFTAMALTTAVDETTPVSNPIALDLQAAFVASLHQVVGTSQEGGTAAIATAAMQTSTVNGDCGGSASYSVNYNEASGIFSGSFSYYGFCSGGVNLSGSASFSGRMDISTGFFDYFSFTFSSLTTSVDGFSNTISGTLECDLQGSDITTTVDMVVQQSPGGQICWLNNYTVQVTGSQMELSGRFYDPVHGYVDFVTLTPLTISESSQFPSSGLMEFTGAVGTEGQQTKAQLLAISSTTCRVTADIDGDGINDYDTGEILWTEL